MTTYRPIGLDDQIEIRDGMKFHVITKDGLMPDGKLRPQGAGETNREWADYCLARIRDITRDSSLDESGMTARLMTLLELPKAEFVNAKASLQDRLHVAMVTRILVSKVMLARSEGSDPDESPMEELFLNEGSDPDLCADGRFRPRRDSETYAEWNTYVQAHVDRVIAKYVANDQPIAVMRAELSRMFSLPPDKFHSPSYKQARQDHRHVGEVTDKATEQVEARRLLRKQDQLIAYHLDKLQKIPLLLQANEVSRIHWLLEGKLMREGAHGSLDIGFEHTFVVRHNWLAVLGDTNPELGEWELPYDACLFEFKVGGHVCITHVEVITTGRPVFQHMIHIEADRWWNPMQSFPLTKFLEDQIAACCVVLEAEVATHEVVRQPAALQASRAKKGKPAMVDYHVIDLSRKRPRISNPTGNETPEELKGRKRLHFCRGHWRTYPTHRTRIPWCLKGNAELGFVDKMYKL